MKKKKQKHQTKPSNQFVTMENSNFSKPPKQIMIPFLLPQIISSVFTSADKSILNFSQKFKLIQIIHYLISLSLFFLRLFLSLLPSLKPSTQPFDSSVNSIIVKKEREIIHEGDSGIARALSQILSIMNDIPVNSRKYETVRCLAEKIIDENLEEGCEVLLEVNRTVLSNAFARTLCQLEAALLEQERERVNEINGSGSLDYRLSWVWNAVRVVKDGAMSRVGGLMEEETSCRPVGWSAEKFAAEILWLAQKLIACGNGEEAVLRWGAASSLASLAFSAEPRTQGTMVKVSALLFKHLKEMGAEGFELKSGEQRERKKLMLMSWLPFLCRASNGIDTPVLSNAERMELEKVLEEIIETLRQEDEQEKVLALWLHHFTSSPLSDWPNLQACYSRWCNASRKLLVA
ncbi:hypothetical protein AQUCO_01000182v1 [Aquilegia coerulea]|uniref:Uncharacterized protein n=1 Tax=Aquilegia coerulea TaxID=218851 RepID=A0A2G5E8M6_AQUCA|nr:hypothetical protein AQUCO_01000182v1 [Aquilegia coerulea]